jgi:hypothetical protein
VPECIWYTSVFPLQVILSPWEVLHFKTVISPPLQNPARQVLGDMPKLAKRAQIDPNFFQHTPATTSTSHAKFHTYTIFQALVTQSLHLFYESFRVECQNCFSSAKLKTKHSLHLFSYYLHVSEVSAHFHLISCPISNFKLSMGQFIVQTSFSRRLTSVFPNLSDFMQYLSMYIFNHISYAYDYVTNMCSPLLPF